MKRILCRLLAVTPAVVVGVRFEGDSLVVSCRPRKGRERRCPVCGRRCRQYDPPRGARRWRTLDLCAVRCYLEYAPCRVECPEHGVRVEGVPWAASARSRFTTAFEEQAAWLCVHCNSKTISEPVRVDWHTVGGMCARVETRLEAASGRTRLDGLRRIGIDETSHAKGHNYLTVVVNHDDGCVVWCARGHDRATPDSFFDLLTDEQRVGIEVVTRDGASWIADVVSKRCPGAEQVMDPFHAVKWVTDALDEPRRRAWREASAAARRTEDEAPRHGPSRPGKGEKRPGPAARAKARAVKDSRYALLKNPEDLTERQERTLAAIERESPELWRAYNLKERFRDVFKSPDPETAEERLGAWLSWAQRCRIPEMVAAQRSVRARRPEILRAVELRVSNARVEAINNKIKVTQRMAYGFRNIDNLISLVMLRCSDLPVTLPGRALPEVA